MKKPVITIVLDKRRIKTDGTYPVKLRVFQVKPRIQKLYYTPYNYTEKDFTSIWLTTRPRNEYKEQRQQLQTLEITANQIIDDMEQFSFERLESLLYQAPVQASTDLWALFDEVIEQKLAIGSISTAEKYELAKKSLTHYISYKKQKPEKIRIEDINVKFLEGYTYYTEHIKKLSAATVGIYVRNLRCIYRIAIQRGGASVENYPFLKEGFKIPTSNKVNKALSEAELKLLWATTPQSDRQQFAKDFWFFSYYSYGMNTKDICQLKHSSIDGESFYYVRAKTKNTKKDRSSKQVPLTASLLEIIQRQKNDSSEYLFGIIDPNDSAKQKHEKIKLFNRLINKYFREFALFAGIDKGIAEHLGTYHARHSFATTAIRKGHSIALISEILHDGNLKVTENYINSFPKDVFRTLSEGMEL